MKFTQKLKLRLLERSDPVRVEDLNSNMEILDQLDSAIRQAAPPGTVLWHAAQTAPDGYLICDGSTVNRTTYAALFAAIGTKFGAGDGSTTFRLPDLRAAFIRGAGSQGGYSATFGSKQEASSLTRVSLYDNSHNRYDIRSQWGSSANEEALTNRDKTTGADRRYDSAFSYDRRYIATNSTSSSLGNHDVGIHQDYVRPYNIALTPIIKY